MIYYWYAAVVLAATRKAVAEYGASPIRAVKK